MCRVLGNGEIVEEMRYGYAHWDRWVFGSVGFTEKNVVYCVLEVKEGDSAKMRDKRMDGQGKQRTLHPPPLSHAQKVVRRRTFFSTK